MPCDIYMFACTKTAHCDLERAPIIHCSGEERSQRRYRCRFSPLASDLCCFQLSLPLLLLLHGARQCSPIRLDTIKSVLASTLTGNYLWTTQYHPRSATSYWRAPLWLCASEALVLQDLSVLRLSQISYSPTGMRYAVLSHLSPRLRSDFSCGKCKDLDLIGSEPGEE